MRPLSRLDPVERGLVERFRDRPVALLSVDTDDEGATFADVDRVGRDHLALLVGRPGRPDRRPLGDPGVPVRFLIDGDGVIRASPRHQATTIGNEVEALLARIPARPSP